MARNLKLTKPYMRGADVRRAQRLLKTNKYGDFLRDGVDGVYGPVSATAVYRAKYWLGYPPKHLAKRGVYGPALERYLQGAPLPPAFLARRKFRLRARNAANSVAAKRKKMVTLARRQVGVKENPPNSNRVKFSTWYGMIGPWCAMFVTWCGVMAGLKAFKRGVRWAYVPYMDHDADAGRNGIFTISFVAAKIGDIATMHFGSGISKHVGIVWTRRGAYLILVEGNTSPDNGGSQDNGGTVAVKVRARSQVRRVIRVKH